MSLKWVYGYNFSLYDSPHLEGLLELQFFSSKTSWGSRGFGLWFLVIFPMLKWRAPSIVFSFEWNFLNCSMIRVVMYGIPVSLCSCVFRMNPGALRAIKEIEIISKYWEIYFVSFVVF